MKAHLVWVAFLAILFLLPLPAQLTYVVVADIPFGFYAGNVAMPAGEYRFQLTGSQLALGRKTEGISTFNITHNGSRVKAHAAPMVVFTRYSEDRVFLAKIVDPRLQNTQELVKSKRERELVSSRIVAQNQPETIVLMAKIVR
jgi:hypothetical protein